MSPGSVDIVVLPEMAFSGQPHSGGAPVHSWARCPPPPRRYPLTPASVACAGYSFSSYDEVAPFAEEAEAGPTFGWASQTGKPAA